MERKIDILTGDDGPTDSFSIYEIDSSINHDAHIGPLLFSDTFMSVIPQPFINVESVSHVALAICYSTAQFSDKSVI